MKFHLFEACDIIAIPSNMELKEEKLEELMGE